MKFEIIDDETGIHAVVNEILEGCKETGKNNTTALQMYLNTAEQYEIENGIKNIVGQEHIDIMKQAHLEGLAKMRDYLWFKGEDR